MTDHSYYVEDDDRPTISPDETIEGSDWNKQAWDLPPYKSPEFFQAIGGVEALDSFRKLPVYNHAVAAGLIHDDEWLADHVHKIIPKE